MPSSYTSSLRLTLPATGELSGTWGTTVNTGITELTDAAIAGYVSVAMTDADYTLTVANGATDQARRMMLNMTGTLTAARNVICPTASKLYVIKNATTGGFAITLKTSAGTGISIPNGRAMLLMCDGTNVVDAVTNFSSLTLGAALPATSGGTGQATYAIGDVLYASSTSALSRLADVATGSSLISGGVGVAPSWGKIGLTTHVSGTLPTANGGTNLTAFTANGVVYASSTSALTTGTALTFNGSVLSAVSAVQTVAKLKGGSAAAQSAAYYVEKAGSTTTLAAFGDSAAILGGTVDQAVAIYADSSIPITFNQSSTERMRITSGGNLVINDVATIYNEKFSIVGTGTASVPTSLSALDGALALISTARGTTSYGGVGYQDSGGGGAAVVFNRGTSYDTNILFCTNPAATAVGGALTERARIDSSGNLGLGVTPTYRFDVSSTTASAARFASTGSSVIARFADSTADTGYIGSGTGLLSGLARTDFGITANTGNALVFGSSNIERARISSGGTLGLGVTPSAWSTGGNIQLPGFRDIAGGAGSIRLQANTYYDGAFKYIGTGAATFYQQNAGEHKWTTAVSGTAGNAITFTDVMNINTSGDMLVGSGLTQGRVGVIKPLSGTYGSVGLWISDGATTSMMMNNTSSGVSAVWGSGDLALGCGGNNFIERIRIDATGNLLVGKTAVGFDVAGVALGSAGTVSLSSTGTASFAQIAFYRNSTTTVVGSITTTSSATAYNTSSDQRLKTNIVDAPDASALIDNIKVRSFDWVGNSAHQRYGFVAQELVAVAPEAVHQPVDPDEMMAVDYSKLVPMLVKEIQSLRARVAALES